MDKVNQILQGAITIAVVCLGIGELNPALAANLVTDAIKFSPNEDEAAIQATGAASVTFGNTTIYIGTYQKAEDNQDPIITSFTNGVRDWVMTDYETTGADSRGLGLLWDGVDNLYAAFTTDGTQGDPSEDFRRFTTDGWLTTYGAGGGGQVTVLLKLNPTTGQGLAGTFVSSLLSKGNSNTLLPTEFSFSSQGNVILQADSYFAPRRTNTERMEQTFASGSPFDYRIELTPDLSTALSAISPGWDGVPPDFEFPPMPPVENGGDDTPPPVENGGGDTPPPVDDDVVSVPEPSAVSGILMLGLGLLKMSRNRKVIKR